MAAPETRALARIELEPAADELLDLDARLEIAREKGAQPRCALDPRGEQPGIGQLGEIGDRVGVAKSRRSDADHRADIGAEPVFVGPVVLGDRTRVRPGAKEQRQETALEDIDETRKRVVPFEKPTVRFFGRGQRQGALRAEHAQETGLEAHAPVSVRPPRLRGSSWGIRDRGFARSRRIRPRAGALRQCAACPGSPARGAAGR